MNLTSADVSDSIWVFLKRHIYIGLGYWGWQLNFSQIMCPFKMSQDRNSTDAINSDSIVETGASFNT